MAAVSEPKLKKGAVELPEASTSGGRVCSSPVSDAHRVPLCEHNGQPSAVGPEVQVADCRDAVAALLHTHQLHVSLHAPKPRVSVSVSALYGVHEQCGGRGSKR